MDSLEFAPLLKCAISSTIDQLESEIKDYFTYMTIFAQSLICHILLNYQLPEDNFIGEVEVWDWQKRFWLRLVRLPV